MRQDMTRGPGVLILGAGGNFLLFICLCDCDFCSVVVAEWSGGGSCNSGAVAAVAAVGAAATAAVVAMVADEWSTRSLGRQGSTPLLNVFTVQNVLIVAYETQGLPYVFREPAYGFCSGSA